MPWRLASRGPSERMMHISAPSAITDRADAHTMSDRLLSMQIGSMMKVADIRTRNSRLA